MSACGTLRHFAATRHFCSALGPKRTGAAACRKCPDRHCTLPRYCPDRGVNRDDARRLTCSPATRPGASPPTSPAPRSTREAGAAMGNGASPQAFGDRGGSGLRPTSAPTFPAPSARPPGLPPRVSDRSRRWDGGRSGGEAIGRLPYMTNGRRRKMRDVEAVANSPSF